MYLSGLSRKQERRFSAWVGYMGHAQEKALGSFEEIAILSSFQLNRNNANPNKLG